MYATVSPKVCIILYNYQSELYVKAMSQTYRYETVCHYYKSQLSVTTIRQNF